MRKDRLLKLADYLETVPRRRFNMGFWGNGKDCGFAGCAMGWAAHGKLFKGFICDGFGPHYQSEDSYGAISKLFGIGDGPAFFMFNSGNSGTPKQVAKRIRAFVASNGEIK